MTQKLNYPVFLTSANTKEFADRLNTFFEDHFAECPHNMFPVAVYSKKCLYISIQDAGTINTDNPVELAGFAVPADSDISITWSGITDDSFNGVTFEWGNDFEFLLRIRENEITARVSRSWDDFIITDITLLSFCPFLI